MLRKWGYSTNVWKTNASFAPEYFNDVIKFIQTICYSGKPNESLVDIRVRLYKNQKIKGSVSLPADPDSMKQAILRVHHQLYYWLRLDSEIVDAIPLEVNGWKVVENTNHILPIWFTDINYCKFLIFLTPSPLNLPRHSAMPP